MEEEEKACKSKRNRKCAVKLWLPEISHAPSTWFPKHYLNKDFSIRDGNMGTDGEKLMRSQPYIRNFRKFFGNGLPYGRAHQLLYKIKCSVSKMKVWLKMYINYCQIILVSPILTPLWIKFWVNFLSPECIDIGRILYCFIQHLPWEIIHLPEI